MQRNFLILFFALVLSAPVHADVPNVVLIMCDDLVKRLVEQVTAWQQSCKASDDEQDYQGSASKTEPTALAAGA